MAEMGSSPLHSEVVPTAEGRCLITRRFDVGILHVTESASDCLKTKTRLEYFFCTKEIIKESRPQISLLLLGAREVGVGVRAVPYLRFFPPPPLLLHFLPFLEFPRVTRPRVGRSDYIPTRTRRCPQLFRRRRGMAMLRRRAVWLGGIKWQTKSEKHVACSRPTRTAAVRPHPEWLGYVSYSPVQAFGWTG